MLARSSTASIRGLGRSFTRLTLPSQAMTEPKGDEPALEPAPEDAIGPRARALGRAPLEYAYDLLLQRDGRQLLFTPFANYAELTAADKIALGGGVASEDEDIQLLEFTLPELWAMMVAGEIVDAKTLIAVMWLRSKLEMGR